MSKRDASGAVSTAVYENFLYLLWEMESAIGRNVIQWSTEMAESARCRLEDLASALNHIVIGLRNRHGGDDTR
jgi:hypothetical protein